jgi:uncharacterized protein GlcG (DUF336 family)
MPAQLAYNTREAKMYSKDVLGLEEARKAVDAVIQENSKKNPDRPISVAVVDDVGTLICFQRQDGSATANGRMTSQMAYNKAYTAVMFNRHTREFDERMEQMGVELPTWGDFKLTDIPGGLAFKNAACKVVGGIGVSGLLFNEDEEMAYVGLNAVKF